MANRTIAVLTPQGRLPVGSNYPELTRDGQGRFALAFDASTEETCEWAFICPQDYTAFSGNYVAANVMFRTTGDTNSSHVIYFEVAIEAISSGDTIDTDAASSFATAVSGNTTIPGTDGYPKVVAITSIGDDGMAAGDMVRVRLNRDPASDDVVADVEVLRVELLDDGG